MNTKNQHIILKTKNLTIGYKSKKSNIVIANNINISLNKGELVGLVGANGIGKSTLLRTLTQVQESLEGTIILDNNKLSEIQPLELAKFLSLVLTEQMASKNLTVFELVALGRQPYTNWIGKLSETDIDIITTSLVQTNILELKNRTCFE